MTADDQELIAGLAAKVKRLEARNAELVEVLADWERTPGNQRDAAWWHTWEDKRRDALAKAKEPDRA